MGNWRSLVIDEEETRREKDLQRERKREETKKKGFVERDEMRSRGSRPWRKQSENVSNK